MGYRLSAVALAMCLFLGTAQTALMATITVSSVCGGLNDLVEVDYQYNDQTLQMTNLVVRNNSGGTASIIAQLVDPQSGEVLFTQANGINENQPQITVSIANLHLGMIEVTGPHGTSLQAPVNVSCTITPGR